MFFLRFFFSFECPFSTPPWYTILSKYPQFLCRYQHKENDDLSGKKNTTFSGKVFRSGSELILLIYEGLCETNSLIHQRA